MEKNLIDNKLIKLALRLSDLLAEHEYSIVTAESCTGGWLAHILTSVPNSSTWFERGLVTYSEEAKIDLLGVDPQLLKEYGPVSQEVAIAMAKGAFRNSKAEVSIAITGLAGPGKDNQSPTPIGTCWVCWSIKNKKIECQCQQFEGDRTHINFQAIELSLSYLINLLKK